MIGIDLTEAPKELLETHPIHARQVKAETLARDGIDRGVEIGPLVGAADDVGWTKAFRAVTSLVPVDQSKACHVKGQDLQRFVRGLRGLALVAGFAYGELLGELFLKASCSSVSAFSCRGRPVLSFTLRRLKSPPTLSG